VNRRALGRKCDHALIAAVALAVIIPLGTERIVGPHLTLNHTYSLPPGVYWRSAVPATGPQHGQIVIVCIPSTYAAFAHDAGLLAAGECSGLESMMKIIIGTPGDHVHLDARGVRVNGRFVNGSRPLTHDDGGRRIPHVPYGDFVLAPGHFWLATPEARSFDSRYYGSVDHVLSIARPLVLASQVEQAWNRLRHPFDRST